MKQGLLIYNNDDYIKNEWFANQFIEKASSFDMNIRLVITNKLDLGIRDNKLFISYEGNVLKKVDFVINRSRNAFIAKQFEQMGVPVFNSSYVTDICNDKAKTHQLVNANSIKSVDTLFCNKDMFNPDYLSFNFPIIVKSCSGHGGSEVFLTNSITELINSIYEIEDKNFMLQDVCKNPGVDVRVFVLGKKILASVKRYSDSSFKSNFSLGGKAVAYELKKAEKNLVNKIISLPNFDFDFVGIDFILDENENFLFNEIEDAVGTRTLYQNFDIDVVDEYLKYIGSKIG